MPTDPIVEPVVTPPAPAAVTPPAAVVPPVAAAVPPPGAPAAIEPPAVTPPAPAAAAAAKPIELKLPDKSLLGQTRVDKIAAYAKEQGLSQEQAQALVNRESEAVSEYQVGIQDAHKQGGPEWTKRVDAYESAIVADKEIGGDAAKESAELAKRVINRFATDGLKTQLDATGFGSHPELVRLFVRIGKTMGEDSLVVPGKTGAAPKDPARALYNTMEK